MELIDGHSAGSWTSGLRLRLQYRPQRLNASVPALISVVISKLKERWHEQLTVLNLTSSLISLKASRTSTLVVY
jgi:hypothetical protein